MIQCILPQEHKHELSKISPTRLPGQRSRAAATAGAATESTVEACRSRRTTLAEDDGVWRSREVLIVRSKSTTQHHAREHLPELPRRSSHVSPVRVLRSERSLPVQ